MIALTRLKKEVQFNGELTKVVDVLKGVAAARFHSLERQLATFDLFLKLCEEFFSCADLSRVEHPFVRAQTKTTAVLMITSDAGFLGGLNSQVVNMGLSEAGPSGPLTIIGERGAGYLRDMHREFTSFPGIQEATRLSLARTNRDHLAQQVLSGQCGRMAVVYPKPVSFLHRKHLNDSL